MMTLLSLLILRFLPWCLLPSTEAHGNDVNVQTKLTHVPPLPPQARMVAGAVTSADAASGGKNYIMAEEGLPSSISVKIDVFWARSPILFFTFAAVLYATR